MTVSEQIVLICQHRTCRKQGATRVFTAFKLAVPPDIQVNEVQCFGQCGNGPMVLILPDIAWYRGIHPSDVSALVQHHFIQDDPGDRPE